MRPAAILGLLAALSLGAAAEAAELRSPDAFRDIADEAARSRAAFEEAGKVLQHPRCVNCHPATERPLQGDLGRPHQPPVARGPNGHGVVGMQCGTCHQSANVDLVDRSVPGDPHWHLAPASMAWEGLSLGEICRQIKDRERNGGRDLAAIVKHSSEDSLVGWGWNPGKGRTPAPGSQETFGELMALWAETGAHCPAR